MDDVRIDRAGAVPTYTITMGGLVHINFDFKLLDSAGTNKVDEKQGVNTAQPRFTFKLDAVPISGLDGRILSLVGVAASFDGSSTPQYDVTVTVDQGANSTPMTVTKPALSGGSATFFGSVKFTVI